MMKAVRNVAFMLACLACTFHGWRVKPSTQQLKASQIAESEMGSTLHESSLHWPSDGDPIRAIVALLRDCFQPFLSRNASSFNKSSFHQFAPEERVVESGDVGQNVVVQAIAAPPTDAHITSTASAATKIPAVKDKQVPAFESTRRVLGMRGGDSDTTAVIFYGLLVTFCWLVAIFLVFKAVSAIRSRLREGCMVVVSAIRSRTPRLRSDCMVAISAMRSRTSRLREDCMLMVSQIRSRILSRLRGDEPEELIYDPEMSIRASLVASGVGPCLGRILIDCSHEFLFRPPFFDFLQQCGYEVHTTQVGLRPDVVFAFDACVIWSGSMEYSNEELATLEQYVKRGGGLIIAGTGDNVESAATFLGLPAAGLFDPDLLSDDSLRVAALPIPDANHYDQAMLSQLFQRLTASHAGDSALFSCLGEVKQRQLELDFCTICFPDSLAGERAEELGGMARRTYEAVAEQFGYHNTEERMHITALLCCGAGWQASKYIVGIGCLGPLQAVQSVMIHEFSNSLCVELTSMGGDAGWSTYVQDKVKRRLGWAGHDKTTEQIHAEAVQSYQAYEAAHGVVDPSSEDAYAHGANGAIIAKWKALYTHYEMKYGDDIMHKYFHYARKCANFLIADGWDRLHDRMIIYFSLATGEDQTAYFESMGYVPKRRWSDEIRKNQESVICSSWGCSGNERPSGIPVDHPVNALAMGLDSAPTWAAWDGFDDQGCQSIVVKEAGCYLLEVAGAAGNGGGRGAVLRVRANLAAGAKLRILVGQRATSSNQGGGGATVVWLDEQLFMVAGGGGTCDACLTEDGGDAYDSDGRVILDSGGRNGRGGQSFMGQGGQGGAGWLSSALDDPEGPDALSEGGDSGHRWDPQMQEDKYGGLGGGGAEWYGGGGGGGYSGGSGCPPLGQSGGGGSWIASGVEEISREVSNDSAGFAFVTIASASGE